ncbi:MAG: replication-associated recombination protein A [bacterium]
MDLFTKDEEKQKIEGIPLARRMCPVNFDEFVGQEHILGQGNLLRRLVETDRVVSIILYGPPGCGKNAIAHIIAQKTESHFESLNAVTCGVADVRRVIEAASQRRSLYSKRTILLVDEIHHFNKTQQDALLPDVERGTVTLIGITTENPYFYVNSALISRSQVFELKTLGEEELKTVMRRAIKDKERGFGKLKITMQGDALSHIARISNGDARRALNALEVGVLSTRPARGVINFTLSVAEESIQKKAIVYDKKGDEHYDTISAFIKSMRGSDPDAVLYWLAKMIYAGEDPRFIARRIVICAAEDVGNADPQALVVSNAAREISEFVGMPEARIPLAQAAVYVACAPKSNASYLGIEKALKDVKDRENLQVPLHLKDSTADGDGRFGHGVGYKYPHDYPYHWVKQEYMPEGRTYYCPQEMGYEAKIKKWLEGLKRLEKKETNK